MITNWSYMNATIKSTTGDYIAYLTTSYRTKADVDHDGALMAAAPELVVLVQQAHRLMGGEADGIRAQWRHRASLLLVNLGFGQEVPTNVI